jgi:G3E family GTPase
MARLRRTSRVKRPARSDLRKRRRLILIPVTVLTGFLGSGKTTLLAALLRSPALARTAVIINEFGEVGLDHDLVAASDESFVTLQTGCLCCSIRGDLVLTLQDLLARRVDGTVMPFERIVIETSGLADPAPILQALMTDATLAEQLVLAGVVTTVDALTGMATLDRQPEAVKQAAVADRLILTKTDLGDEQVASLLQRLRALNPAAPVIMAVQGAVDPADVLRDRDLYDLGDKSDEAQAWLTVAGEGHSAHGENEHSHDYSGHDSSGHDPNRHDASISCFAIVREKPFPAVALTLLLEILAEHCGADLLRMKGILQIAESPEKPAVVHGVQHVFHPPVWLEAWPSADRRSRLVFIGRNLSRRWIEAVIAAIEAEVADVGATQLSVPG